MKNQISITELVNRSHETAKEKGFWDKERSIPEMLMLIVSELGEALEAHRTEGITELDYDYIDETAGQDERLFIDIFQKEYKDKFADEIADVFIRLADMCGGLNIDIEKHIELKMKYNKTRERLHGKKY